jgi:predicted AlkP superfamily phosphohydrolase/phosphomutase
MIPNWCTVAAPLVLAAIGFSCARTPPSAQRVRVIGIDGAAWRVIDPLLERGALPNLARLIADGVRAPLRSQLPIVSPTIWTTIATGVSPARHGITDFHVGGGRLVSSTDRKVPALWSLASEAGLRSAVVGWWVTYPAESTTGVIVSDRALRLRDEDVRTVVSSIVRQPVSTPRLEGLVQPPEILGLVTDLLFRVPNTGAPLDPSTIIERARAEDAAVARTLLRLRERAGPFDLELLLLRGTDPVSHRFWKFYEPNAPVYAESDRPTRQELEQYRNTIEDHYRYVDGLLGELVVSCAGDCAVLVLSDHGFEAGFQGFGGRDVTGAHHTENAIDGILVASGGPLRRGVRLAGASILDLGPTVLHLLGLAVPEDLEGRVLTDALEPDWVAAHPVRRGPAHRGPAVSVAPEGAAVFEERLRQELRALGYVE